VGSCGLNVQQTDSDPDNADLSDVGEVLASPQQCITWVYGCVCMGGGSERASVMLREFRRGRKDEGMKAKAHKDGNLGIYIEGCLSFTAQTNFKFLQNFYFAPVQQPSTPLGRTYI